MGTEPRLPEQIAERLAWKRAVETLRADGHARVALYGAGRHTSRFLDEWGASDSPAFVAVLDDRAQAGELAGRPIQRSADLVERATAEFDAVLLSSDAFEDALWDAASDLRERGLPVYRIYANRAPAAEQPDPAGHDSYEPIFEEIALLNPEAYHVRDGLSEANAIIYHRYSRREIHDRMYAALAPHVPDGGEIVDVGSGRGYDTRRLAGRFPRARVVGMEYAPKGVELSARYASDRLRFVQGDATAMPFDEGRFDAAFSLATIEHVAGQETMAAEIFRVLKPGGVALVATHPEEYWRFWFARQAEAAHRYRHEFDFHGLPVERMAGIFAGAGFESVEIGFAGFLIPQRWLRYFQGIDFNLFFRLQSLLGWIYRNAGHERRLYYQYHLVRKPGGSRPARQSSGGVSAWKTSLSRLVAAPLYHLAEPRLRALRDRCADLD